MACLSDTKHLSQKGLSGVTHASDTSNKPICQDSRGKFFRMPTRKS
jgi:hypothetical protein